MEDGKNAGQELQKVILNQIELGDPPITKVTYNRLLKEIKNKKEVLRMMACVLGTEIFWVLKNDVPMNEERYEKRMRELPDESYLDEE